MKGQEGLLSKLHHSLTMKYGALSLLKRVFLSLDILNNQVNNNDCCRVKRVLFHYVGK